MKIEIEFAGDTPAEDVLKIFSELSEILDRYSYAMKEVKISIIPKQTE